jgi:hypothetical protein
VTAMQTAAIAASEHPVPAATGSQELPEPGYTASLQRASLGGRATSVSGITTTRGFVFHGHAPL